jgi:hypothetical protein
LYCSHGDIEGECRFHLFPRDFKWGKHKPEKCIHKNIEVECKQCLTDGAWAILKAGKDLRQHGHSRAIDWARGYLGLDENRPNVVGARVPMPEEDASWSAVNMPEDD